jgi:hypothetical protein
MIRQGVRLEGFDLLTTLISSLPVFAEATTGRPVRPPALPPALTHIADSSFVPMTAQPLVENIPGFPAWERVIVEEPVDPAVSPRLFSRIQVAWSDAPGGG